VTRLRTVLAFLWDFVIGDDWRIAVGVAAALILTLILSDNGTAAWWLLPIVVGVMLTVSVWSVARHRARPAWSRSAPAQTEASRPATLQAGSSASRRPGAKT
jgi:hypothetical protein